MILPIRIRAPFVMDLEIEVPDALLPVSAADALLSERDAAAMVGIAPGTLKNERLAGKVQAVKCGRVWKYRHAWLEDYLAQRTSNVVAMRGRK